MLFTELPFLDRFAAAARAGFEAVEFLFPYEYDAGKLNSACRKPAAAGAVQYPTWRRQRRRMGGSPRCQAEAPRPASRSSWRWSMPASWIARRYISWPAWYSRGWIAQPARPCLSIICALRGGVLCPPRQADTHRSAESLRPNRAISTTANIKRWRW